MADSVATTVIENNPLKLIIQFTNLSDGTGESAVAKVDKSTYTGLNGLEPSYFVVEKVEGTADGMSVAMICDRTAPIMIGRIGGQGRYFADYMDCGGLSLAGAGGTGDIQFTTNGHSSGDSYTIVLHLRKAD